MGATGDPVIGARTSYPDSLIPGEIGRMRLLLVRDGLPVTVDSAGTFDLIDSAGTVQATGAASVDADGALSFDVPAATTADLAIGQLYQARWSPAILTPGDVRGFRREVVVAPFRLSPPIADQDLTVGNYPDLVTLLGGFSATGANGESTLQPYIDQAWAWFLRRLFKVGRWPDLMVSTHDAVEATRERAWYLIFRFLFRSSGGDGTRFEVLMRDHEKAAEREWSNLSARWDFNRDGLADSEDREPGPAALHINGAPRRRLSRRWRW